MLAVHLTSVLLLAVKTPPRPTSSPAPSSAPADQGFLLFGRFDVLQVLLAILIVILVVLLVMMFFGRRRPDADADTEAAPPEVEEASPRRREIYSPQPSKLYTEPPASLML